MTEYIGREAAMQHLLIHCVSRYPMSFYVGLSAAAKEISAIPAADAAEVRHGYWDDNIIDFCNVCMECGAIVERTAIKSHTGALNYCPNCGAKMDGKGEGE